MLFNVLKEEIYQFAAMLLLQPASVIEIPCKFQLP